MSPQRRRFGKVRKLPSQRFQASYLHPTTGQRIVATDTFRTKTEAGQWLVQVESAIHRDEFSVIVEGRKPFEQWAQHWLDTRQVRPSTRIRYENLLRMYVQPAFARRPINSITRADVTRFIADLGRNGVAEGTVSNARRVLAMILREAHRSGALFRNPADGVRVKRSRRTEMVSLTRQQVLDLAREISHPPIQPGGGEHRRTEYPEYGLMVRLVAETGLRSGEVAALRVGRVDLKAGRLHIVESASEVPPSYSPTGLIYQETKTYESRSVPIPATLLQELGGAIATRQCGPDDFVFTAPNGCPLRHSNLYRRFFKPAVLRAGLPPQTRFHDLRHTYAALLIAADANALTVKQRLGHSSITVTYDRYGHLFPHLEQELTNRMDAAYRQAVESDSDSLGHVGGTPPDRHPSDDDGLGL